MKQYCIYALFVENEDLPFYIGKTYLGSGRLSRHICPSAVKTRSLKSSKIKAALAQQKSVCMRVLEIFESETEAFEAEKSYISKYGRLDLGTGILCNHTDGGEGASGAKYTRSDAHKQAISRANSGRKRDNAKQLGMMLAKTQKAVTVISVSTGETRQFESVKEACRQLGTKSSTVCEHMKGKIKNAKGSTDRYLFLFKDDATPSG